MEKSSIQTRIFLFFKNERSWVCKQVCMSWRLFWVNLKVSTRANQKVLTQSEVPLFPFFFFFGKTKSKHKPLWWSGWRALKTMQIRERKDVSVETGVGRGGILRGGRKKKKHNRKQTSVSISAVLSSSSSSFQGSLFTVFLCELLSVLHEPGAIFAVLLRQVGPQRVLRLWTGH